MFVFDNKLYIRVYRDDIENRLLYNTTIRHRYGSRVKLVQLQYNIIYS